jgi:hypothetical protein
MIDQHAQTVQTLTAYRSRHLEAISRRPLPTRGVALVAGCSRRRLRGRWPGEDQSCRARHDERAPWSGALSWLWQPGHLLAAAARLAADRRVGGLASPAAGLEGCSRRACTGAVQESRSKPSWQIHWSAQPAMIGWPAEWREGWSLVAALGRALGRRSAARWSHPRQTPAGRRVPGTLPADRAAARHRPRRGSARRRCCPSRAGGLAPGSGAAAARRPGQTAHRRGVGSRRAARRGRRGARRRGSRLGHDRAA